MRLNGQKEVFVYHIYQPKDFVRRALVPPILSALRAEVKQKFSQIQYGKLLNRYKLGARYDAGGDLYARLLYLAVNGIMSAKYWIIRCIARVDAKMECMVLEKLEIFGKETL